MHFKNKYTQLLSAILLSFLLFLAVRIYFNLLYTDYFSTLTPSELFLSYIAGMRVDMAIIFTFTGLLWLAYIPPFNFTFNKKYRSLLGILWGTILGLIIFFNIGDILYFEFVNRHLSNELSLIGNDVGILSEMAFDYYPTQTIITSLLFFIIIALFYKLFTSKIENKTTNTKEWFVLPLVIVILFLGIRGKISGISFAISDAFAVNKVASGNLALNGFFCFYRGGNRKNVNHSAIPLKSAIKIVKEHLNSKNIQYIDKEYPLMRRYTNNPKQNYNVVIILVESLSAKYIDALAHNNYGVTPTLDKLANDGLLFTNFYANGQRSQEGITTLYTGIVQPVGYENIGEGLELYNLTYLGRLATENGYSTLAMQSSNRGSFHIDKLSEIAGFQEYYGAEDMPQSGIEQGSPRYGVWDGDMLKFLSSKLHTIKEPFLSFSFTASTHAPFYLPGKKWALYPHSNNTEQGYLNTLKYVDDQIATFMQSARKEPWFDRTIFIFTGDHCNNTGNIKHYDSKDQDIFLKEFHIPLIVYAPKILKPSRTNMIASQADILPSITHLLGWHSAFTTISQSIFDTNVSKRFAFVKMGDNVAITDGKGSILYNFKNFLSPEGNVTKELQDTLLGLDTAQAALLNNLKWMKE